MTQRPIIFGSRGSALALAQTRLIMAELAVLWPDRRFDLQIIKTQGDRLSENPERLGSEPLHKGLFTKELEEALLRREIDLAVHSLKDLPTEAPDSRLILAAIPKRENPRDVLITRDSGKIRGHSLDELPKNPKIATGSPRRAAQIRWLRPDAEIVPIRGNIDTRLRKFREQPDWSGLILATAGLRRLWPTYDRSFPQAELAGLKGRALGLTEPFLPAPGQGALALQSRSDDVDIIAIARALHDSASEERVVAERSFLQALGGGCQEPIAAHAYWANHDLTLEGIAWLNGESIPRSGKMINSALSPKQLGQALAQELMHQNC